MRQETLKALERVADIDCMLPLGTIAEEEASEVNVRFCVLVYLLSNRSYDE